jgi:hypothetical protein
VGEQDVQIAVKRLDGVVQEDVLAGYLKLLDADGCPEQDAGTFLGTSALIRILIARGMAFEPGRSDEPARG